MAVDRISPADLRADARRHFRWKHVVPTIVWVFITKVAMGRLQNPEYAGLERILWILIPALLFIPAYWAWAAGERLHDEMERAINGRAALVAFRLTLFWLFALALLDAAVGLPLAIPTPFNLPDDSLGWYEAAFIPLFFWAFAFIREHRRMFPKR